MQLNTAAYIEDNLLLVPGGRELVRDFVDPQKWISTNYPMSIPGTHGAKVERQHEVEIAPLSILRTPVTHDLYRTVMGQAVQDKDQALPVVNVTWLDAVTFCNRLSEPLGLDPVLWD